ncbi:MAG: flagellar protein FlaG [Desulfobacteraceae bacterium]|nr:flagellar protein FlaG [Desulfobacteraceae bacterium]
MTSNIDLRGGGLPNVPVLDREGKAQGETKPVEQGGGDPIPQSPLDKAGPTGRGGDATADRITKTAQEIQKRLDDLGTKLSFSLDKATDSIVIQVKDKESGEVVRQIPSEEMLELKAKLEKLLGILFDKKV